MTGENDKVFQDVRMRRTSGKEIPENPSMHTRPVRGDRGSSEYNVVDAALSYERRPWVSGLLFKSMKETPESERPAEIDDTLAQWARLRDIKKELRKKNQSGFNLPPTVRGICTLEGESGFLVTDLEDNGANDVFDLKQAYRVRGTISHKDWRTIKNAILQDIDVAEAHDVKIIGGFSGLDAWLVVKNKQTGECTVYLSDISKHTSRALDPLLEKSAHRNDPHFLRTVAMANLKNLEDGLIQDWNKYGG